MPRLPEIEIPSCDPMGAWGSIRSPMDSPSDADHDPSSTPADDQADRLSHVEPGRDGAESRMVDVSHKTPSAREAVAEAWVVFPPGVLPAVLKDGGPKGPILEVARVAGIQGAKRTGELIPMCHPLGLEHVEVKFDHATSDRLRITCRAACTGRTGVEMEALTGAGMAALCIYDMTKALTKEIRIEGMRLLSKKGGKSGHWEAS